MSVTVRLALSLALSFLIQLQPQGTPVLWRDPGPVAGKDLAQGPTSPDRAPVPPFTFVEEDISGSKPKVKVVDSQGVTWRVKFAGNDPQKNEVNAEVAASRVMWALGYLVEEHYFVPAGVIEGVKGLDRAKDVIASDGLFRMARFERRAVDAERTGRSWPLDQNPFVGTRELSGLVIVTALMNNWDNKPENTAIEIVNGEARYFISDLGASFGRMAGPPSWHPAPSRWNVEHYRAQQFVKGVEGDTVLLNFEGQVPLPPIPIEHARWFVSLAGQLTQDQVRQAFVAAGATPGQADGFAARMIEKIAELQKAIEISRL